MRNDNGAIDAAIFSSVDYFNQGVHVSDYGYGFGSTTFLLNDTSGGEAQPVTVTGSTASGTYTGDGGNVAFARTYSLVPGQNVVRVSTSFVNNGLLAAQFNYFDTFDPDQGIDRGASFGTYNDVFTLGGAKVGQARINDSGFQDTVIAGSFDSRARVAAGDPFAIYTPSQLNAFINSPFDGNDAGADAGLHIGLPLNIPGGASDSFTYYLAFGLTPADAQSAFISAVPEPGTFVAGALLMIPLGSLCMRQAKRLRIWPS